MQPPQLWKLPRTRVDIVLKVLKPVKRGRIQFNEFTKIYDNTLYRPFNCSQITLKNYWFVSKHACLVSDKEKRENKSFWFYCFFCRFLPVKSKQFSKLFLRATNHPRNYCLLRFLILTAKSFLVSFDNQENRSLLNKGNLLY